MGRAVVRRHAALIAVAACLLAGCSRGAEGLPTGLDFQRAQTVWSDPWLAPDRALVPEAGWGSPDGYVRREAGTRTTAYRGGTPEAVLSREVAAALARGWVLTGATCTDQHAVSLARGDGLDSGATAVAVATREGRALEVVVTGSVPHHLDGSWPAPGAELDPADTCLKGGPDTELVDVSLSEPFGEVQDTDGTESEWQRDEGGPEQAQLLEAVNEDPWVQEIGLNVGSADLAADDAMRRAPTGRAEVTGTPLTDLVDGMGGWELTWASCGRGRPTELTARFLTGVGSAVARISAVGDRVTVSVALPMPEAPVNEWVSGVPKLDADARCLAGPPPGRRIVTEGIPVATVAESQPIAD